METYLSVRQAGGFIIQLMPDCPEETMAQLEANLEGVASVTTMFEDGMGPLDILEHLLCGLDFRPLEVKPVAFACNCSRERTERVLIAMGAEELQSLVDEGKPAELVCNFCNSTYTFSVDELAELLKRATES